MISEVNLAQKASSPSAHDKPKKMKKTIVAEKTMDTIVYPRWMWIRRALSRGKYLFNLLLEKVAIVYLLIVKGMSAIWKRTEQKRDVKCWSWTWMSELLENIRPHEYYIYILQLDLLACIEQNSMGGTSLFAQYLGAPSGTAFSCCWNLIKAKWAE